MDHCGKRSARACFWLGVMCVRRWTKLRMERRCSGGRETAGFMSGQAGIRLSDGGAFGCSDDGAVGRYRIKMAHDIQHVLARHDAALGIGSNGMALGNGQGAIHFKVYLDPDLVTHLARAKVVEPQYAGCFQQQRTDPQTSLVVDRAVQQVMKRVKEK